MQHSMSEVSHCTLLSTLLLTRKIAYIPFNKTNCLSLNNEKLDTLSKHYGQLCVVLIDEASLVGATKLYRIDKRLR